MVAKVKKDSKPTANAIKKSVQSNGIAKKNKKAKNATKDSSATKEKVEPMKNVPTGKHIVFDDNDKPVAANAKKKIKKGPKEDAKDIGKRWYEEVNLSSRFCSRRLYLSHSIFQYDKFNLNADLEELKETEISELIEKCRKNYENYLPSFEKSKL